MPAVVGNRRAGLALGAIPPNNGLSLNYAKLYRAAISPYR